MALIKEFALYTLHMRAIACLCVCVCPTADEEQHSSSCPIEAIVTQNKAKICRITATVRLSHVYGLNIQNMTEDLAPFGLPYDLD